MARTTSIAVQRVLGDHYDTNHRPALDPFIRTANVLTNQVVAHDTSAVLLTADLAEIECYLAAHFYAHADQIAQSKNTGGASGSFQGQTAMVLMATLYGQTACMLDASGYLAKRSKEVETGQRRVASVTWLGENPDNQTPYQ